MQNLSGGTRFKCYPGPFSSVSYKYTQHKASVAELTDAINELTAYLVEISTVEQDYAVLLRYYSMGLNKLKLYRMQFGQKENTLYAIY